MSIPYAPILRGFTMRYGIMTTDVILLGTSLKLEKGRRVQLTFASNQPEGGWFARPADGKWSDGIEHGEQDSIHITENDFVFSTIRPKFLNGIKTGHRAIAVCEWRTYDVLGNARDGFEVNDSYNQGEIEIPVELILHNVPSELPSVGRTGRGNADILLSYEMADKDIRKALDIKCGFETDGDDVHIYINKRSNGKPMAEITILRYEAAPE
jgi:hypothetical protein